MKNNYLNLSIAFSFMICPILSDAQTVAGFDDLTLPSGTYWDGADNSGGFQNGNAWFNNTYDQSWLYWSSGFAYSNVNDSTTSGYANLYAAKALTGFYGSANYAVAQQASVIRLTGTATGKVVSGMYVTNSTYAANSMRDGDSFAKKFGGASGDDADWFLLTVFGYSNGNVTTDSVNFYLADYRFANNTQDYIVESWEWVDLSSLGNVDSVIFFLSSSDTGSFGMNTPAFFAIDNFTTANSPASVDETELTSVRVFPNPASEFIFIETANMDVYSVSIINMNGETIIRKENDFNSAMDIRSLPSGIYFVQIISNEKTLTRKLIKN
jgi:hypothetical protein